MIERRVKCTKCSKYAELVIDESETLAPRGWTCRHCGYANTLNVAGDIAWVEDDLIDESGPPPPPPGDRREHTRVALATVPLFGRRVGALETFKVEEASQTGFSIMSRTTYDPGTSYQFRMWSNPQHVAIVAAVCRSCALVESEPWLHRVGFQFLPQSGRRLRIILGAIAVNSP